MVKSIHRVSVIVDEIIDAEAGVRLYRLKDEGDWELPPFTAGAHVDVHLPSGSIRQYSLCGNPANEYSYEIAVKRDANGRGGSIELHDTVVVGQELLLSLPRNTFPIGTDHPVVIVAGGIGITPFLSALPALKQSDHPFHLHYSTRADSEKSTFSTLLRQQLDTANYSIHRSGNGGRLNITALLDGLDEHTHVYCCGPEAMLEAVQSREAQLAERLHIEHFHGNPATETAYRVHLKQSDRTIDVSAGQTMLQALRMAGIDLPSSCEAGICLECKCRWLAGNPVHRELAMPKADRAEWLSPCVSGCADAGTDGSVITLDL